MRQYTAIFERKKNGKICGWIFENPHIQSEANTLGQARTELAKRLRKTVQHSRKRVERGKVRIEPLEVNERASNHAKRSTSDQFPQPNDRQFLQLLVKKGLIEGIPDSLPRDGDELTPIRIAGKPISERMIEERR